MLGRKCLRYGIIGVLLVSALVMGGVGGCAKPAGAPAPKPSPTPVPAPSPTPTPAPKPILLRFAHYYPPTHSDVKDYIDALVRKVEERSKGEVKFEVYPAESLVKSAEIMKAIQTGVIEIGPVIHPYVAGEMPLQQVVHLPFIVPDDVTLSRVIWKLATELDVGRAEYEKFKLKPIMSQIVPGAVFVGKKPMRKFEDLRGLRIRTPGGLNSAIIDALGATSISMAAADQYMALQRGTVDATLNNVPGILGYRLYEVAKHITLIRGFTPASGNFSMNLDVYNSLPKHIQQIISDAGREVQKAREDKALEDARQGLEEAKKGGAEVYVLPDDEIARWKEKLMPVWDEWIKKNGAAGRKTVDFIVAAVKAAK